MGPFPLINESAEFDERTELMARNAMVRGGKRVLMDGVCIYCFCRGVCLECSRGLNSCSNDILYKKRFRM